MNSCLSEFFRCPEDSRRFTRDQGSPAKAGYFQFGPDCICYGTNSSGPGSPLAGGSLPDLLQDVRIEQGTVHLPFDPRELLDNYYRETYVDNWRTGSGSALSRAYYFLRPALPVSVRRHLQKLYLSGWDRIAFPGWPVDCSADALLEQLMLLSLRATGLEKIPFIWFWPDGASSCATMTHDVETQMGCSLCSALMDVDDSFGIKASFQIVPEERYGVSPAFLESIRSRGFDLAVHDLNHDGHLYRDRKQFLERAVKINAYGREFNTRGFRAGALYRRQIWFDALDFAYDMSVPNAARLDPQRGGCCTVMPFFIGNILEIPVTTVQDYTLFNILHDYTIDLWRTQIGIIMSKHGLMSFIVHPDYSMSGKELAVYQELLAYLSRLRQEAGVWIAVPVEINRWWRQRAAMQLVQDGKDWLIEGEGSERARLAYAAEQDGRLVLTLPSRQQQPVPVGRLVGAPLQTSGVSIPIC